MIIEFGESPPILDSGNHCGRFDRLRAFVRVFQDLEDACDIILGIRGWL